MWRGLVALLLLALVGLALAQNNDTTTLADAIRIAWNVTSWQPPCSINAAACSAANAWPGVTWNGSVIIEIDLSGSPELLTPTWPLTRLQRLYEVNLVGSHLTLPRHLPNKNLPCLPDPIPGLAALTELREFIVNGAKPSRSNCLFPDDWDLVPTLTLIDVDDFDTWPTSLNALTKLQEVHLDRNAWTGPNFFDLSLSASTLYSLTFSIDENTPQSDWYIVDYGAQATWLQLLSQIQFLEGQRVFSGTFSCTPGSWPNLIYLDLSNNGFTGGSLPVCMSQSCASFTDYHFAYSGLTGPFPTALSACPQLQYLDLQYTDMQGSVIPTQIGLFPALQNLHLENLRNHGGPIPAELGNIAMLQEIHLRGSNFTGVLPPELGKLRQLQKFDAPSNNLIYGTIPEEWAFMSPHLDTLTLWGTGLQGDTPGWLLWMGSNTTNRKEIDLGRQLDPSLALRNCSYGPNMAIADQQLVNGINFVLPANTLVFCNPCQPPRPDPAAVCYQKQWTVPGSFVVNGSVFVGNTPIIIQGNLTVPSGGVVSVTLVPGGTAGTIVVSGTAVLNGTLSITITDTTLPPPFVLVNASTIVGNFTGVTVNQPSTTCFSAATSSSGGTLAVLFSQPSGSCGGGGSGTTSGGSPSTKDRHLTAILAGSIAGGILVVALVVFLMLLFHRKKRGHWVWASVEDDSTINI